MNTLSQFKAHCHQWLLRNHLQHCYRNPLPPSTHTLANIAIQLYSSVTLECSFRQRKKKKNGRKTEEKNRRRTERGGTERRGAHKSNTQSSQWHCTHSDLSAWAACRDKPASKACEGKTTVAPWHGTCRHPSTIPKQWYSGTGMQMRASWKTKLKKHTTLTWNKAWFMKN